MKGFTLVEVIVVAVIVAILAAVAIPILATGSHKIQQREVARPTVEQFGAQVVCIEGYKFIMNYNFGTQIIDAEGNGVLCNEVQ